MESQIILATRTVDAPGYFSVWLFGKRVPGSHNPFRCLEMYKKEEPYDEERLGSLDVPVLLQSLIKWSEE